MSNDDSGKTTETDPSGNTEATDTAKNVDKTSPKAGDGSNISLWLILFIASGGAVTLTILADRKKKYNK